MMVYQLDTGFFWTLQGGIADINWVQFTFAGGPTHHMNVGGGTYIATIPLYNYEDHDTFNTSWCWRVGDATHSAGMDWLARYDLDGLDVHFGTGLLANRTPLTVGEYGGVQLDTILYQDASLVFPTQHLMVKSFAIDFDPNTGHAVTEYSLAIGFWDDAYGLTPADYPTIVPLAQGVGFAYGSSWPAALFPNQNYYAVCSAAGNLYVEDTGIAITTKVAHKFNVIWQHHIAYFYIDNLLTNTIDQSNGAGSAWPDDLALYPSVSIANRHTVGQNKQMTMMVDLPFIWASDHVPLGPDP
jgi:hypothetical protein